MDREFAQSLVKTQYPAFVINLDMSSFRPNQVSLLMAWLEIWLKIHCQSGWRLVFHEAVNGRDSNSARVEFEDGSEALLFKLSPEFLRCQGQSSPYFSRFISKLH